MELRAKFIAYLQSLDFQLDEIERAFKQAQKEFETFDLLTIEVLTRDILQENATNSKLIFKERCELMGLLTQIKQLSSDKEVINLIFEYFNAKYSLFEQTKRELPYHYRVITPSMYRRISQIPEEIVNLDDGINFLINYYYRNSNLTEAQKAVMSAEELLEKDCQNAHEKYQ